MEPDDELLPLSALQHLEFCRRRCALIHVEGLWSENAQTAEGRVLHRRVHEMPSENVGGVRVARGLRLASRRLGMFGVADVVEFHLVGGGTAAQEAPSTEAPSGESPSDATRPHGPTCDTGSAGRSLSAAVALPGLPGLWRPYPVEYKRGRRKPEMSYFVQLCGQALCLEEMLGALVPAGALYHGKSRRRQEVLFDDALRRRTEALAVELHELIASARTPPPEPGPKCRFCSLVSQCVPKLPPARSAQAYLARMLDAHLADETP